jgi:hypothetical protein
LLLGLRRGWRHRLLIFFGGQDLEFLLLLADLHGRLLAEAWSTGRVVGVVGPRLAELRLGLTDEDGSPGSVAKLLVDVRSHRRTGAFAGVEHRPTAAVNGQGACCPCSPFAHRWCAYTWTSQHAVGVNQQVRGTATDTLGPEGMWIRRDGLVGSNPGTPASPRQANHRSTPSSRKVIA